MGHEPQRKTQTILLYINMKYVLFIILFSSCFSPFIISDKNEFIYPVNGAKSINGVYGSCILKEGNLYRKFFLILYKDNSFIISNFYSHNKNDSCFNQNIISKSISYAGNYQFINDSKLVFKYYVYSINYMDICGYRANFENSKIILYEELNKAVNKYGTKYINVFTTLQEPIILTLQNSINKPDSNKLWFKSES